MPSKVGLAIGQSRSSEKRDCLGINNENELQNRFGALPLYFFLAAQKNDSSKVIPRRGFFFVLFLVLCTRQRQKRTIQCNEITKLLQQGAIEFRLEKCQFRVLYTLFKYITVCNKRFDGDGQFSFRSFFRLSIFKHCSSEKTDILAICFYILFLFYISDNFDISYNSNYCHIYISF